MISNGSRPRLNSEFSLLVGKRLTVRTLSKSDPFAQTTVIGFAVGGVEVLDWRAARDTYWHYR